MLVIPVATNIQGTWTSDTQVCKIAPGVGRHTEFFLSANPLEGKNGKGCVQF